MLGASHLVWSSVGDIYGNLEKEKPGTEDLGWGWAGDRSESESDRLKMRNRNSSRGYRNGACSSLIAAGGSRSLFPPRVGVCGRQIGMESDHR